MIHKPSKARELFPHANIVLAPTFVICLQRGIQSTTDSDTLNASLKNAFQ